MADEKETTLTVRFVPPDPNERGFMRRVKKASQLMDAIDKPDKIDELITFLAQWCQADTPQAAEDYLWDASQNDFRRMLKAVMGAPAGENPT